MNDPIFALLQQKMAEGTWDSSGAFTIEAGRAASRLGKDFVANHPGQYPLKLVQAAVSLAMKRLVFYSRAESLRVEFFEPRIPEFFEYFKFALQRVGELSQATPFLDLFQGIWGGLAEHAHQVEAVLCWDGQEHRFEFSSDGVRELSSVGRSKGKNRPALTLAFSRSQADSVSEGRLILDRCDFAPLDLVWNGRSLPRDQWVRMSASTPGDWYKRWAPPGFRLGESYLGCQSHHPGTTIWLPRLEQRGAKVWGEGMSNSGSRFWRPNSKNVLYHSGVGAGTYSGALAQTLDAAAQTPALFVSKGVLVDSPSLVPVLSGGLAVLECSNLGLRTDVFGLRLVVDRQHNSVIGVVKRRLAELHQRIRPHIYPLPTRRGLADLNLGMGILALASVPFAPVWGAPLVLGAGQIAIWKIGKIAEQKLLPHGFVEMLSRVLPECVPDSRLSLSSARDPRRYRLK